MRILLAEDNELNQDLAIRLLSKHGHEVTLAENGARAVERYEAGPGAFDLILMDLNMPVLDGRAAARVIRASEAEGGTRIPILAMTATADATEVQRALDAGMDGSLEKPIDVQVMLQAIEDAVRGKPVEATSREVPVDRKGAVALLGGDEALLRQLASTFLESEPGMRAAVRAGVEGEDALAVEEAAHKLRGALGNFAAHAAHDWAKRLEHLAASGDLSRSRETLAHLEAQLDAVRTSMSGWLDGSAG